MNISRIDCKVLARSVMMKIIVEKIIIERLQRESERRFRMNFHREFLPSSSRLPSFCEWYFYNSTKVGTTRPRRESSLVSFKSPNARSKAQRIFAIINPFFRTRGSQLGVLHDQKDVKKCAGSERKLFGLLFSLRSDTPPRTYRHCARVPHREMPRRSSRLSR